MGVYYSYFIAFSIQGGGNNTCRRSLTNLMVQKMYKVIFQYMAKYFNSDTGIKKIIKLIQEVENN